MAKYTVNSGVIHLRGPSPSALWYLENTTERLIQLVALDLYLGRAVGALDSADSQFWLLHNPTEGTLKAGSPVKLPMRMSPPGSPLRALSLIGAEQSTIEGGEILHEFLLVEEGHNRLEIGFDLSPEESLGLVIQPKTFITQQDILFIARLEA
jgi:hypothetical protein